MLGTVRTQNLSNMSMNAGSKHRRLTGVVHKIVIQLYLGSVLEHRLERVVSPPSRIFHGYGAPFALIEFGIGILKGNGQCPTRVMGVAIHTG